MTTGQATTKLHPTSLSKQLACAPMDNEAHDESDFVTQHYANVSQMVPTVFELSIDFGCDVEGPTDWLTRVSMTWEHARVLERHLQLAIADYEQQVGTIRDVEGLDTHSGNGGAGREGSDDDEAENPDN